jgi:response regulator of citrate/malate metabolism
MNETPVRTLIVDDDFRVAKIHAAYVAKTEGFEVIGEAHSASEALAKVDELRPDLVLMDVYLPDGDGLGVVRKLMERDVHPDCVVITAARDVNTVRTAMQLGVVHYLVKPFGFAALQERLTAYRDLRLKMATLDDEADQSDVDALFGLLRGPAATPSVPSKGHSAPTLELVRNAVRAAGGDISAAEVADRIGISRPTAQRYLSYLTQHGVVRLQLKYGTTGRPEHRYTTAR